MAGLGAPLLPAVDFVGLAQRSKPAGGVERDTLRAALNASYEIDFWGKNRAALLAAQETAVASRFDREVVALTTVVTHSKVEPKASVEVKCEAPDLELLFVEWLNAIIYEMAVRGMLFGRFAVRIEDAHLEGTMWGEPVDVARHAPACEAKGATYTALKVAADDSGCWSAGCVVDV